MQTSDLSRSRLFGFLQGPDWTTVGALAIEEPQQGVTHPALKGMLERYAMLLRTRTGPSRQRKWKPASRLC